MQGRIREIARERRLPWRSLKRRMSKDDVRRILSEPEKIAEFSLGSESTWYDGYPLGGQLIFYGDRLSSWSDRAAMSS